MRLFHQKGLVSLFLPMLVVLAVLGLSISPVVAQQPPPPAHDVNVQPERGAPGTEFAFYATGFADGEIVDVWLNSPDGRVLDAEVEELYRANPTGRADWYWQSPDDAHPGFWQMVALGRESGVQYVIDFAVSQGAGMYEPPDTDDVETFQVHPHTGTPATEFAFYATGFDVKVTGSDDDDDRDVESEGVKVWVESPDWRQIELEGLDDLYVAPPAGRVDWTWTAPPNAMPGTWHMVILGRESGLKHVIPFEIVQP